METAIIIGMGIIVVAYGAWVSYEQKRKNDKIFRELDRIRYGTQYAVNCIEMGRLTPHGPRDRDDYFNMAVQASRDVEEIAVNLAKEL